MKSPLAMGRASQRARKPETGKAFAVAQWMAVESRTFAGSAGAIGKPAGCYR
jgi:hypothetical protein